jgi:alginate biosynthesis protein AlgK
VKAARGLAACALAVSFVCAALPPEPDLPDLRRGQKAAAAGNIAEAERDLVPLSQMGYLEAQIALAGLYAQSEEPATIEKAVHWFRVAATQDSRVLVPLARVLLKMDEPSTFAEAEKFLRAADKKGDPRALAALLEFYTDHPERDEKKEVRTLVARAEKDKAPEPEAALIRWYRHSLPDERLEAALAQRCAKARDRLPECYVDLARYYRSRGDKKALASLAADAPKRFGSGAMPAPVLERTAWSMVTEGVPGEPQPELAYPLLKRMMESSPTALVRVARLQVEYPQLDPGANPEKLLQTALAQGSLEAALALGRLYMNGTRVPADPAKAERYLREASATQPAAHYFLGRIYKRGELGVADPERAAGHLLSAARGGYARADYLLAQLFSDNRGVRVNRVNAWVFATLAARNGIPEGKALAGTLLASMAPPERKRADELLQQELVERARAANAVQQQQAAASPGVVR